MASDLPRLTDKTQVQRGAVVHNLTVRGTSTYFVGRLGAWVHNCKLIPGTQREMLGEALGHLKKMKGDKTSAEMADSFEGMAKQISDHHPNWRADRSAGGDGSAIFQG